MSEEPKISDRGFKRFDPIVGSYTDTSIRVYESSNAEVSAIWVLVDGEVWTKEAAQAAGKYGCTWPSGIRGDMSLHLPLAQAVQLRDQLTHLIDNHYHRGYYGDTIDAREES